jgi:hypothetical protein
MWGKSAMAPSQPVELQDIPVMYVASDTGLAGASMAFDRLEAHFPSLKGRKFYGTFLPPDGPYRACVAIQPDDDPETLGLPMWTIPGGTYRRAKVLDWAQHLPEIGETFERMAEGAERDRSRPSIEFYRSMKELVLFLPVR